MTHTLIVFRVTDNDAGGTQVRVLLAVRLVLFALLLPILLSTFSELGNAVTGTLTDPLTLPVLAFLTQLIFWVLMILIGGGGLILVMLPFLTFLLVYAWYLICSVVGLLLEITIVVPRMFLGSVLDPLLHAKRERYPTALFSPAVTLLLVAMLPAIAMASGYAWFPWYRARVAAGERLVEEAAMVRLHNQKVAKERQQQEERDIRQFLAILKQARLAETIAEAKTQLRKAEDFLRNLPSREREKAEPVLKAAFKILDIYELHEDEKLAGELRWRRELRPLLYDHIERYGYLFE